MCRMGSQRTKNGCCLTGMKVKVVLIQMMIYDLFLFVCSLFIEKKVVFLGPGPNFVCGVVKIICSAQSGGGSVGADGGNSWGSRVALT